MTTDPFPVLADLCLDLVWPGDSEPQLTPRTTAAFQLRMVPGQPAAGIRFPPDVVEVRIDWSWPGWARGRARPDQRARVLEAALLAGAVSPRVEPGVAIAIGLLGRPSARIASVADVMGTTERSLRRWSQQAVGLSPKQVQRRLRALRFIALGPDLAAAERAVLAGFYDQAHASGELPCITGLTAAHLARYLVAESSKTQPR